MEENTITLTKSPEEMKADLVSRLLWLFVNVSTIAIVVLIETLLLNRGCTL